MKVGNDICQNCLSAHPATMDCALPPILPPNPEPMALLPCPCCQSERIIPPPVHWPEGCVYCRSCGLRANSPEAWNTLPEKAEPVAHADLVERLTGRARFCRDRGEIKTPELLEAAAAALRERDALVAEVERLKQRPWCETCGKTVPEVLCQTCAKWWADNDPQLAAYKAMAEEMADALAPFSRAQHIVASVDDDWIRCVLSYPYGGIEAQTFTLASLDQAKASLSRYQAMKDQADG